MSLILSRRLSKLSFLKKHALVGHRSASSFTMSLLKHVFPFINADDQHCGSILRNGNDGYLEIFKYPHDVVAAEEPGKIGASKGSVLTLKEGVVCLQDRLNPNEPDADRKRISLPPLVTLPHCQTQIVTNVAMSSSSPEDDDCIVAIKFLGPQLSLCRPARSSEWTNIRITDQAFFNSRVMYSKRDGLFKMPASGGAYIGSWNLGEETDDIPIHNVKQFRRFRGVSHLVQSEWELLSLYSKSEHLVEFGHTGETYLVKWYTKSNFRGKGREETQRFMVFKIDDEKHVVDYTRYIGGCIFLTKAEAFCIQGSSFPEEINRNLIIFEGLNDYGTAHIGDSEVGCCIQ